MGFPSASMGSGTSASCRRDVPRHCSAKRSSDKDKNCSGPLDPADSHGAKKVCDGSTAASSSAVAGPGSTSDANTTIEHTTVVPLAPEDLGCANPILAAAPLCGGRLQLSITCRAAHRAVQHLAAELVKWWNATSGFDLSLLCAKGDLESVWVYLVSGALHCDAAAPPTICCSPVLYALAGQHKTLARLLQSKGWEHCLTAVEGVLQRDALHAASTGDMETILVLLASGQQINGGYTFGWTLLMGAAGGNQLR